MVKMKEVFAKFFHKSYFPYVILLLVSILLGFPCFQERMLNGHDGIFHLFRIYSTKVAILDHQLIPMVNANMMGGFGYASNLFYGILSAYLSVLLSFFIPSLGLSVNLVIWASIFFSGVTMYCFMKHLSQKQEISLLAAIFYMAAPYHLFDIYVRLALGEILAFVFIPLVFDGIYQILSGNKEKWYLVTIGTAGLLLTHTMSAFLTGIFAFFYLLLNWKKVWNFPTIKKLGIGLFLAILFSFPTILPLLEAKISSDYMVFDSNYMKTTGEKMESASISLLENNPDPPVRMVQIYTILLLATGILILLWKYQKKKKICPNDYFLLACLSILLTLDFIPWKSFPQIFSIFQFPWRFLQMTSFLTALVFAFTCQELFGKKKLLFLLPICFCFGVSLSFWNLGMLNDGISSSLLESNALKKRGEIVRSTGTASAEYLPRNVIYRYDYLITRNHLPLLLEGEGKVENTNQNQTHLESDLTIFSKSQVELPYIYYPGYVVYINQKKIPTFETENGMVGILLEKGSYHMVSYYRGTNLMIFSYLTPLFSSLGILLFGKNRKIFVFSKK